MLVYSQVDEFVVGSLHCRITTRYNAFSDRQNCLFCCRDCKISSL